MQEPSPIGWAFRPLQRYADFSGRAPRAELWWFVLGLSIFYIVFMIVLFGAAAGLGRNATPSSGALAGIGIFGIVVGVAALALLIPSIAVQVRRLHDIGRSGWWLGGFYLLYGVYFFLMARMMFGALAAGEAADPNAGALAMVGTIGIVGLAQFVYFVVLIVFYCLPGTKGPNRFGPDPYGRDNFDEIFA